MTPQALRQSLRQTYFTVVCDSCHGRMFEDGVLCFKCRGEGRLLVAEERVTHISQKMAKSALFVAAVVCLLVAAVVLSLK